MIIRRNVILHYSAFPKNCLNAYRGLLSHYALIPFGVPSLDNMIDGGLLTGTLTEIYGSPSSGKTKLCYDITAHVVLQLKQQVMYVDAKGGFSGKSLRCRLESYDFPLELVEEAQKNVTVISVKCINELLSLLYHLRSSLNQEITEGVCTRLIIIDSLPSIFYQFIGETSNKGLGFMNSLATILKCIAVENRVAILLINLPSKGSEYVDTTDPVLQSSRKPFTSSSLLKPALGNYWFHVPNLRLFVRKIHASRELEVIVTKSSSVLIGKTCRFCAD
ncbi:DNA repair protein RAD51 homolog 4-like isoform X2 [Ischnura elegans]|nr:DNA repair protein RAD51 homolog 4-like isoform X2 [Ischnura elegans]